MTPGKLAIAVVLTVIGMSGQAVAQEPAARGRTIVEANCSRCHAVGRTGASPLDKAPPFRDLSKRYPLRYLEEALAEGIVTGHNEMPEFKFAPAEVDAILTYIESISAK